MSLTDLIAEHAVTLAQLDALQAALDEIAALTWSEPISMEDVLRVGDIIRRARKGGR